MTIIRKEVGFREGEFGYPYLQKYQEQYPDLPLYKILELIFEEHSKMKAALTNQGDLTNEISSKVVAAIKTSLDVTRVRTGYIDKNIRSLMLLVNSYIIIAGIDEKLPIKELDIMSKPMRDAEEKVKIQIQNYKTKKHSNKEGDDK